MVYFSLALQVVTLGLVVFVFLKVQELFREIRNPVVRHKNQLPNEFKDRLRSVNRSEGDRGPRPEGNRENRGDRNDRGPRPEGNRENRGDRNDRGPRPEGNRENRGDRNDRGPRPERQAEAPAAETSSEAPATAPVTSGRRPLTPVSSAAQTEAEAPATDALAATSFAQPVAEAPRSFGRRQLPKAKPRFDEDDAPEENKEATSA